MTKKASAEESIEQLLTADQVMRSLHVSRSKMYLMVATGELHAVHLGRSLRFRARDVQALIDKRAAEGAKPKASQKKGRT